MSRLLPTNHRQPFDCTILPPPYDAQCEGQVRESAPGSCHRLPPRYRPFCRALPPRNPLGDARAPGNAPSEWPASALVPPRVRDARVPCGDLAPSQFYNCLWSGARERRGGDPLINSAFTPCTLGPRSCWPSSVDSPTLTGEWVQVAPSTEYNSHERPKVWMRHQ